MWAINHIDLGLFCRMRVYRRSTKMVQLIITTSQPPAWSINVYSGILGKHLLGSFFFYDGHMNSDSFTPHDFLLCGYIKYLVYRTLPATAEDMRERFRTASRGVLLVNLQGRVYVLRVGVTVVLSAEGSHFEHLIKIARSAKLFV